MRISWLGEEGALGLARRLGVAARLAQVLGQLLQRRAAAVELAHLAQRQQRESQRQRRQRHRQPDADHVVVLHRRVARGDLLADVMRGAHRQAVDLLAQCHQLGLQLEQRVARRALAARGAEYLVGAADEAVHAHQRVGELGLVGQDAGDALVVQQADAADPDVVAQLQRRGVEHAPRVDRAAPLVAQAQVLGLGLVDEQHGVVVGHLDGLAQQRGLAHLQPGHRQQGEDQPDAEHAQPGRPAAPCVRHRGF